MNRQIKLTQDTIDKKDIKALCEWLSQNITPKLTKGELTLEYEAKYANFVERKHAIFCNSGSSANLLMISALLQCGMLKNKKVIIPSLCWITTISPIIQLGLTPILCDINLLNLSVDIEQLEELFAKEKPAALFLVSVLGMPPLMDKIQALCDVCNVVLIMDNCESQGSYLNNVNIEKFGVASSCSNYFGHITSTIEGGMVTTDSYELNDALLMKRSHGWDRDLSDKKKLSLQLQNNIKGFNALYTFYTDGYNLRNTEIGAFLGLRQLDKLKKFATIRNHNFELYKQLLNNNIWKPFADGFVSNLGYPIIMLGRDRVVKVLKESGVEVRPLISGSIGTQPFFKNLYGEQTFVNANMVDANGFYVPNHPQLTDNDIQYICNIINKFI